jgi:hypothetical protein
MQSVSLLGLLLLLFTIARAEVDITDEKHFNDIVVDSDRVWVVYFARDIKACKTFSPAWEALSASSKRLAFAVVQMDKTPEAWALGVKFNMHKQKLPHVIGK